MVVTYLSPLINLFVALKALVKLQFEVLAVALKELRNMLILMLHMPDVLIALLRAANLLHEAAVLERTVTVELARRVLWRQVSMAQREALAVLYHILVPRLHLNSHAVALR